MQEVSISARDQPKKWDPPCTYRVYISPKVYIPPFNQDWCNDPHIQNSYAIYQHQTRLVANDGFKTNYYIDEGASKDNLMILVELDNRAV